ncbi:MAG TPA: class I SAM-dependent methyltransferase [Candidatus Nanoarchaeia archaeon]|nr:class I SAM-dependent methyltransferase [Candidatus Nanoarchaeia archaeon]
MIVQAQPFKGEVLQTYSFIPTASYGVLRRINQTKEEDILEIGCGTGLLLGFLAQTYKTNKYTAIDQIQALVAAAQKRIKNLKLSNVGLFEGDIDYLVRGKWEIIISSHTLKLESVHGDKFKERVETCNRHLNKRGSLIVIESYKSKENKIDEHIEIIESKGFNIEYKMQMERTEKNNLETYYIEARAKN